MFPFFLAKQLRDAIDATEFDYEPISNIFILFSYILWVNSMLLVHPTDIANWRCLLRLVWDYIYRFNRRTKYKKNRCAMYRKKIFVLAKINNNNNILAENDGWRINKTWYYLHSACWFAYELRRFEYNASRPWRLLPHSVCDKW